MSRSRTSRNTLLKRSWGWATNAAQDSLQMAATRDSSAAVSEFSRWVLTTATPVVVLHQVGVHEPAGITGGIAVQVTPGEMGAIVVRSVRQGGSILAVLRSSPGLRPR